MSHKCPYCRFQFNRADAITENIHGVNHFYCPNPEEENDRKVCGKRLPLNFFNSDSATISLVGSHFVGKTHYFLALLYQLKNNKSLAKLGIQGDLVGGKKENPEIYYLLEQIERGIRLEATTSINNAIKGVIDISITTKGKRIKHIYLSLYDNPGEDFLDISQMINDLSNVFQSDGIIFLIEPKQLIKFQEKVLEEFLYEQKSNPTDFYEVLNNVIQLLNHVQDNSLQKLKNNIEPWGRFKRPLSSMMGIPKKNIAFTISKFDQISTQFHTDIPFDESGMEDLILLNDKLNEDYLNQISNEIEDIICDNEDGDVRIQNVLSSGNINYVFLGAKSANVNHDGEVVDMKNPQGVSLPLIWLLKKLKKI